VILIGLMLLLGLVVVLVSRRRTRRQAMSSVVAGSQSPPRSVRAPGPEAGSTVSRAVTRASLDAPARTLAAMVGWLPASRTDWGRAMLAELDRVEGATQRWQFAAGCIRVTATAIIRGGRPSWLATTAIGVGAAGIGVPVAMISTQLRVFAVLLAAGVAGCVWLAVTRAGRADRGQPAASRLSRVFVGVGLLASVLAGTYGVAHFPQAGADPTHLYAVVFAAMLVGYLWLVVAPPTSVGWGRAASRYGLIATAVVVASWVLVVAGSVLSGRSIAAVMPPTLVPALALVGGFVGARTRSIAAASVVSLYGGIVGAVTLFVVGMTATIATRYPTFAAHELAVSDNLGGLIAYFLLVPLATVSLGTIAGLIGVEFSSSGYAARESAPPAPVPPD
jgi:hypothetical protein